jgi:hypothetical protein
MSRLPNADGEAALARCSSLAAASTSLRRVAASNSHSGSRSCLVSSRDPCRRLYTRARANRRWPRFLTIQPSIHNAVAPGGTFLLPARSPCMRQEPYDWPRVGGFVVVWLVIAVVAGMGLFALFDPGSVRVLVTAEL